MDNIEYSNKKNCELIQEQLKLGGTEKLHVITDFDRTLTHALTPSGEFVPSLISILRDEDYLVEGYSEKAKALYRHYYPIEVDSEVPLKDKRKQMKEWSLKHAQLLIDSKLNKKDILASIKSNRIRFRQSVKESLSLLNKLDIPVVVFSASGLGEFAIRETLKYHGLLFSNIIIVSNRYIWNEEGYAVEYVKPRIYIFNKNHSSIEHVADYDLVKDRKNVVLIGDSLADVEMIGDFDYNVLLKIGFLNTGVDQKLIEYKRAYDLVISNDSEFDFVYNFLKEVLQA